MRTMEVTLWLFGEGRYFIRSLRRSDCANYRTTDDKGGSRYRYADGVLSYNGNVIYCVREEHKHLEKEVVKEIVSVDVRDGFTKVLATGNDFYAHPRVSSNGKKLAYITW